MNEAIIDVPKEYRLIYYKHTSEPKNVVGNAATDKQGITNILFVTKERFGYCVWKNTIWYNFYAALCNNHTSEFVACFPDLHWEDGACIKAIKFVNNYTA
jgi:hypothetical protein